MTQAQIKTQHASIGHGHFTIERLYDAMPARVFRAWSDPAIKAKWFIGPEGWSQVARELDSGSVVKSCCMAALPA